MSEPISGYAVGDVIGSCPSCETMLSEVYGMGQVKIVCAKCGKWGDQRSALREAYEDFYRRNPQPTDRARRDNDGKPRYSLIDFAAIEPLVRVLEYGADRYGRDNWKLGLTVTSITDSLMRHLVAYMGGEDDDPESGLPHLGHIAANVMFLLRFSGGEWDDRGRQWR